jgi:hypothetical protein
MPAAYQKPTVALATIQLTTGRAACIQRNDSYARCFAHAADRSLRLPLLNCAFLTHATLTKPACVFPHVCYESSTACLRWVSGRVMSEIPTKEGYVRCETLMPALGCRILHNPETPTRRVLGLLTDDGSLALNIDAEFAQTLSELLAKAATEMRKESERHSASSASSPILPG